MGTVAKADTAVLSLGFVKSGMLENNTSSQRANFGYYTGTYGYTTGNRNFLFFSSSILNPTNGAGRHFGFVVRCENPSAYLLSGSYGLAVGSNLTNGDTVVLELKFGRTSLYSYESGSGAPELARGFFWASEVVWSRATRNLSFSSSTLSWDQNSFSNGKGSGFSVAQESFVNYLSGSYGLAEGTGTNVDTAALVTPMLFFRAGRYDVSSGDLQGTASRGDYWSAVANTSIAYYSDFHNSRLAPSASFSVLWAGFSVRCVSFSILLSGSYGLAEGLGTNRDTAILADPSNLFRSGDYIYLSIGSWNAGHTGLWTRIYSSRENTVWFFFHGANLGASDNNAVQKGRGLSVSCDNLSLIFSPEAMGWPRGIR